MPSKPVGARTCRCSATSTPRSWGARSIGFADEGAGEGSDSLKRADAGWLQGSVDRNRIVRSQTPQGARRELRRAIERGEAVGPRVFTAGETLNVTGGHGWGVGEAGLDSPDSFRRAVMSVLINEGFRFTARDAETVADINGSHRNRRYLPDHELHPSERALLERYREAFDAERWHGDRLTSPYRAA